MNSETQRDSSVILRLTKRLTARESPTSTGRRGSRWNLEEI